MGGDSLKAYDVPERVRTYDIDMDVMHPLRHKMIEIILDIVPFNQETAQNRWISIDTVWLALRFRGKRFIYTKK